MLHSSSKATSSSYTIRPDLETNYIICTTDAQCALFNLMTKLFSVSFWLSPTTCHPYQTELNVFCFLLLKGRLVVYYYCLYSARRRRRLLPADDGGSVSLMMMKWDTTGALTLAPSFDTRSSIDGRWENRRGKLLAPTPPARIGASALLFFVLQLLFSISFAPADNQVASVRGKKADTSSSWTRKVERFLSADSFALDKGTSLNLKRITFSSVQEEKVSFYNTRARFLYVLLLLLAGGRDEEAVPVITSFFFRPKLRLVTQKGRNKSGEGKI